MKSEKYIFLLLVIFALSCSTEEDFQLNRDHEINFAIVSKDGLETKTNFSFQNQSANLYDYQWKFGDGISSTEMHPEHNYQLPGKYTVTLSGSNTIGETVSYQKDLFVREDGSELDILFISYKDSTLNFLDLSTNITTKLYQVPYNPAGVMAFDESASKIYYYDYSNNIIIENNLEGNNPVTLLEDMSGVTDMEFDQKAGNLYISLSYDDLILIYNVVSESITPAFNSVKNGKFGKVRDMDVKGGNLYTITNTQSYEAVFQVNMSDRTATQLIDYQAGGYGYGVAYDELNDRIFFNNVEEAALMQSDADGKNIKKVIDLDRFGAESFTGLCIMGLKVVETRNKLLWSAWEDGTLHILDLETSQEEVLKVDRLNGKFIPFENTGHILD